MVVKQKKTATKSKPSSNGRNGKGQFTPGNQLATGMGDHKSRSQSRILRNELLEAITRKDVRDIAKALLKKAKKGDTAAIKELLDRCLGKPHQTHGVEVESRQYTPDECETVRAMLADRCN